MIYLIQEFQQLPLPEMKKRNMMTDGETFMKMHLLGNKLDSCVHETLFGCIINCIALVF